MTIELIQSSRTRRWIVPIRLAIDNHHVAADDTNPTAVDMAAAVHMDASSLVVYWPKLQLFPVQQNWHLPDAYIAEYWLSHDDKLSLVGQLRLIELFIRSYTTCTYQNASTISVLEVYSKFNLNQNVDYCDPDVFSLTYHISDGNPMTFAGL